MSMELNREELDRDPYLASCLNATLGEVPMEEVDWTAMRGRIHDRAELPLKRLRARSQPRRWRGPVISLAAAAGVAAVALLGAPYGGPTPVTAPTAQISIAPGLTVEDAMRADMSDQEFGIIASGRENTQVLLQIAANTD